MKMHTLSLWTVLWCGSSIAAAEGLTVTNAAAAWPKWQARVSLTTGPASRFALTEALDLGGGSSRGVVQGGALLGDYYFRAWSPTWLSSLGGFRATSGVLFGSRSLALTDTMSSLRGASRLSFAIHSGTPGSQGSDGANTVPYLGVGYTGLSLKGGWGFSADLGLTAEGTASALRSGRALFGTQGSEFVLRELRLSPLLQLGVSYTF